MKAIELKTYEYITIKVNKEKYFKVSKHNRHRNICHDNPYTDNYYSHAFLKQH